MTLTHAASRVLSHPHPAVLLPTRQDLRTRDGAEYRAFFDNLVADVRIRGVQQPIIAYKECERLRVLDGETRRQASLLAGIDSVPVLASDTAPPEAELALTALQANALRLDMEDLEYATVYNDLMTLQGISQMELAELLHVSPSQVSKRMRIFNNLPEDLRGLIGRGEGKLCGRAAYAICRLPDDESKREIALHAAGRGLKAEAVEALVARKLGKKQPRMRPAKGKTPGGLVWAFSAGGPEAMLAEIERLGKGVKVLLANKWDLELLPSVLKS